MDTLPRDLLNLLLAPFQNNEQSYLLSLVNKQFNSIVKVDRRIPLEDVLRYYAEHGYIPCLNWFRYCDLYYYLIPIRQQNRFLPDNICSYAAYGGQMETIKWALSVGCKICEQTTADAALNGHLSIVQWVKENDYQSDDTWTLQCAARKGHKSIIQYYMSLDSIYKNETAVVNSAAEGGQLELFQWLLDSGFKHSTSLYFLACHNGQLEIIKCARKRGLEWDTSYLPSDAARAGHLHVLQWLLANGCEWNIYVMSDAASNGHLDVMKWAHELGAPISSLTWLNAAQHGHLHVLKWAQEKGFLLNDNILAMSAVCGNIEMMKWLIELGFKMSAEVIRNAASNGRLEAVKWLREMGCPWTGETRAYARRQGHSEVLKWCIDNGCPEPTPEEDYDYEYYEDDPEDDCCDTGNEEYMKCEDLEIE